MARPNAQKYVDFIKAYTGNTFSVEDITARTEYVCNTILIETRKCSERILGGHDVYKIFYKKDSIGDIDVNTIDPASVWGDWFDIIIHNKDFATCYNETKLYWQEEIQASMLPPWAPWF